MKAWDFFKLLLAVSLALCAAIVGSSLARGQTPYVYECNAGTQGALVAGPYVCRVTPDGKASISAIVTVPPKVSLDTKTYRLVENATPSGVGRLRLVVAGSVPAGTLCDPAQKLTIDGAEYFRVDRTTLGLTWTSNFRPPTVWARCT